MTGMVGARAAHSTSSPFIGGARGYSTSCKGVVEAHGPMWQGWAVDVWGGGITINRAAGTNSEAALVNAADPPPLPVYGGFDLLVGS